MASKTLLKKWWFWAIAVLVIILIAISRIPGNEHEPLPTDPDKDNVIDSPDDISTPGTEEDNIAGDNEKTDLPQKNVDDYMLKAGMYKVGQDIEAGEYLIIAEENTFAYFQVSRDSSGKLESIITNDNFKGNRYITVSTGQYLDIRDAVMYPIAQAPTLSAEDKKYPEGMYKVGRDIAAGEYKLIPEEGESAYFEVTSDSKGLIESIVTNDNFTDEKYITISEGQYIKIMSCYLTW